MKCFSGLAVGVLALLCGVVLGHGGRSRFDWKDFFQGARPSTPKSPNFKDTQVNYGYKDDLFDIKQFANDFADLKKDFIGEEELRQMRPKPRELPPDLYCSKESKESLQTFCKNLAPGDYFDPWNPFCGFIRCKPVTRRNNKPYMAATREVCEKGTWISDRDTKMRHGRDRVCRVPLPFQVKDGNKCMEAANKLSSICDQAMRVLTMNDKTDVYGPEENNFEAQE